MSIPPLVEPLSTDINGEIFADYIKNIGGIGSTVSGYDAFIRESLPLRISHVTTSEGDRILFSSTQHREVQTFLACRIDQIDMPVTLKSKINMLASPLTGEQDSVVRLYPLHCLKYKLTYESVCHLTFYLVDASGNKLAGDEVKRKLAIPLMVRANKCWSSSFPDPVTGEIRKATAKEGLEIGLSPNDPGGYFIIYGTVHNLHYSETLRYGDIILMPTDPKDKFADAEVRFTSPTVQGSSVVRVGYSTTYGKKKTPEVRLNYFNMTNFGLGAVGRVPNTVNAFLPYLLFDEFADSMAKLYPEVGYSRLPGQEGENKIILLILKDIANACHPDERNRIISLITPSLEYLRKYINDPTKALVEAVASVNGSSSTGATIDTGEKEEDKTVRPLLPPAQGRGRKKIKPKKEAKVLLADFIKFLYPHIPSNAEERIGKLKLHTSMILKLARYKIGRQELDDRNLWMNKKLDSPGWLMHRLLHTLWRDYLKNGLNVGRTTTLENAISQDELNKRVSDQFKEAFKGKNWGPFNSKSKKEVNDVAKPDSMAGKYSQVTRIKVQASKHGKSFQSRLIAPDSYPDICPVQTPERDQVGLTKYPSILCWTSLERSDALGQSVTVKNILNGINGASFPLASLEQIRKIYTLSYTHLSTSTAAERVIYNGVVYPEIILYTNQPSKLPYLQDRVIVNGQLLGYGFGPWLQRYLIWLRRFGLPLLPTEVAKGQILGPQDRYPISAMNDSQRIAFDTMIMYQEENRLLVVKTDNGRLMSPMLTMNEDGTLIVDSVSGEKKGFYHFLQQGAIEYLDSAERHYCYTSTKRENVTTKNTILLQTNLKIAEVELRLPLLLASNNGMGNAERRKLENYLKNLQQIRKIVSYKYTHCYISPQQMFSPTVLHAPMGNRQPGPRSLLQANMTKQSQGIVDSMQTSLIETTLKTLVEPVNSLFVTEVYNSLSFYHTPTGEHKLLQFGTYFGFNQEDASVEKQEFIEGGGMANIKYHGIRKELEDPQFEEFKNPYPSSSALNGGSVTGSVTGTGDKKDILMPDGLPIIGSFATMQQFVLGIVYENKQSTSSSNTGGGARNKSERLDKVADQGVIDRVVLSSTRNMANVRIRIYRKPSFGDKFAARYGQKVTVSKIMRDAYLPYICDNEVIRNRIYRQHITETLELLSLLAQRKDLLTQEQRNAPNNPFIPAFIREQLKTVMQEVYDPVHYEVSNAIVNFLNTPSISRLNQILAFQGKILLASSSSFLAGQPPGSRGDPSSSNQKTREQDTGALIERMDQVYRNYFGTKYALQWQAFVQNESQDIRNAVTNLIAFLSNPYVMAIADSTSKIESVITYYRDLGASLGESGVVENADGTYSYLPGHFKGSNAGLTPDVIVNPLQIVSRVTIGFVCELAITLLSALTVSQANASRYVTTDYETLDWQLKDRGFEKYGAVQMASGITGARFTRPSYIGIIKQESLKHQSADKISARAAPMSSKDLRTHQPSSASKTAGQRFGEMERDVVISHGSASYAQERLNTASDGYPFIQCSVCDYIVTEHADIERYKCRYCGNKDLIQMRSAIIPYAVNGYIRNLLYAMNMGIFAKVGNEE
jgi:DNA-directed RNA polymerase beta subunit